MTDVDDLKPKKYRKKAEDKPTPEDNPTEKEEVQGQAYLAQYKVFQNNQMNFIYTFNEKKYQYDIKALLARCEQKNHTGLIGLPK